MLQTAKRLMILTLLSMATLLVVNASKGETMQGDLPPLTQLPYIENILLSSSRFGRPDDLSIVNPDDYVIITDDDVLVLENDYYELYYNDTKVSFKVLNLTTGYVWSTALDEPDAGSYNGLLNSGIGIEYINLTQNHAIRQNVGITETEFSTDTKIVGNRFIIDIEIGGYCARSACERLYPDYLENRYTLEQMITSGLIVIGVGFQLEVELTEEGITAHIPHASVFETSRDWVQLSSIILFPSLGATEMDHVPGYMMIPDGVGTLIRYEDKEGRYLVPFEERFYGRNAGITSIRTSVSSYPLSMPVFGVVHGVGQNGYLAVIESGDMNARLLAFPNGAHNLKYNLIFAKFDFKQTYRQSFSSDGTGGAMRIHESSRSDITVHYRFLEGDEAHYTGLALNYQDYLRQTGAITPIEATYTDIPVHIQYLMADSKNRFIGKALIEMSSVEAVKAMYDHFMAAGITHQRVSLLGWNQGGYSGHLPAPVKFETSLGRNRAFDALIDHINTQNSLMLVNNYVAASENSPNVSYRNDVAQGVNRFKLERTCHACVYRYRYLLYPSSTADLALSDYKDYIDKNVEVLFEDMGSTLFSYYQRGVFMREDAFTHYETVMATFNGIGHYYYPNAYTYRYTKDFYHAPLYNSQLTYFDDLVPFLPIVLSGHMEVFSQFLNFNSLSRQQLLMLVDFGINPAYILSDARPSNLRGSDIERYYATQFSVWANTVETEYDFVNQALRHVIGQPIISRTVVTEGVVEVTYANGISIIINYTSQDYTDAVGMVPSQDYAVRGLG